MVDVRTLRKGDRVKIVDKWTAPHLENDNSKMDKWLGQFMTVRILSHNAQGDFARMEEDRNDYIRRDGWLWYGNMIEYVVGRDDDKYNEMPSCLELIV